MFHVLLASYKGQKYITAQISSICTQGKVHVLVSDDVSSNDFMQFTNRDLELNSYLPNMTVIDGPRSGVNANFLHLLQSSPIVQDELYAYSDQDDVWLPNKLDAAKNKLQASCIQNERPSVYMGRTIVCDQDLHPLFFSKGKPRPASFKNALLESIAGGNTMVFNSNTLKLLKKVNVPVHHDWLTYMVVTACGGEVIFDDEPYVLYRQHGGNVIGANNGIAQKFYRLRKLLNNEFRGWASDNIEALKPIVDDMTAESRRVYEGFVRLHHMSGWQRCFSRLSLFRKLGLYRQRRLEHYGFMLAAFLGKI